MYSTTRRGLDPVIVADTYKVNGKFFEFLIDKEVVRTLKVDAVLQIRRMDEDEAANDDTEEGDSVPSPDADLIARPRRRASASGSVSVRVSSDAELQQLLDSLPGDAEVQQLLDSLPGTEELDELTSRLREENDRTLRGPEDQ
jgi:hypothetical protein